jgi:hypothetical protein
LSRREKVNSSFVDLCPFRVNFQEIADDFWGSDLRNLHGKRFVETARKLGVEEVGPEFDEAFRKIVAHPKK